MSQDVAKQAAGEKAVEFIENGMIVGLGTGTTSAFFIQALIKKVSEGLKIKVVASSARSAELAKTGGLNILDINDVSQIDITVDGADQVDHKKQMIKGGGGAHVREKILASSSQEMIVIVDESKVTKTLGTVKLPIEIVPYGSRFTKEKIEKLGFVGAWRISSGSNELFLTDNKNYLFDLNFKESPKDPRKLHEALQLIPGVIETGFFFDIASRVIVGKTDGTAFDLNNRS